MVVLSNKSCSEDHAQLRNETVFPLSRSQPLQYHHVVSSIRVPETSYLIVNVLLCMLIALPSETVFDCSPQRRHHLKRSSVTLREPYLPPCSRQSARTKYIYKNRSPSQFVVRIAPMLAASGHSAWLVRRSPVDFHSPSEDGMQKEMIDTTDRTMSKLKATTIMPVAGAVA